MAFASCAQSLGALSTETHSNGMAFFLKNYWSLFLRFSGSTTMISEYENSMQQGDDLISAHLPLVKRIANHLAAKLPPQIELEDLIQVGLIGLLKANEDYQVDSGASFSTYATIRVRGAMMDELRTRDWLPRSVQKSLGRVSSAMQAAEQRLGRTPKTVKLLTS